MPYISLEVYLILVTYTAFSDHGRVLSSMILLVHLHRRMTYLSPLQFQKVMVVLSPTALRLWRLAEYALLS